MCKIFEYCVLSRLKICVKFHELQFSFTTGGGCDKAVHVVRSVIEYFNEYGSTVYLSGLDISKAYDKLNHCAILLQMKRVKAPIDIILVFGIGFNTYLLFLHGVVLGLHLLKLKVVYDKVVWPHAGFLTWLLMDL